MKCFGLTGGIASGKSVATNFFRNNNIWVLDADEIAKLVLIKDSLGYKKVVEKFGSNYLNTDNTINRKKLAGLIFSNVNAKFELESIVHPLILEKRNELINELKAKSIKHCLVAAPLLFETKLYKQMNANILICSPVVLRIKRLMKRDNLSYSEAMKRINSQMSDNDKAQLADIIINNNQSINEFNQQLAVIWEQLTGDTVSFITSSPK